MVVKRLLLAIKDVGANKLIGNQLSLSENQVAYLNRFVVAITSKTLNTLETMFALNIDRSDSSIKVMPTANVEQLESLCGEPLFVISSEMAGELEGNVNLLMRSSDFKNIGELMKPIFKLLFLSSPDADLATLERQKPSWMKDDEKSNKECSVFHEQMMDALTEMANVLFGVYAKAFYETFDLHTYHTLPELSRDADQASIQQVLSSSQLLNKQHFVIENEFSASNKLIKLWCLISPSKKSLQEILSRIG